MHGANVSTAILKPVADELTKEEQRGRIPLACQHPLGGKNARDFAHRLVLFHSNDVFIQLVQQLRRCEEVISKHRESDGRFIAPSVQDGIYIYMYVYNVFSRASGIRAFAAALRLAALAATSTCLTSTWIQSCMMYGQNSTCDLKLSRIIPTFGDLGGGACKFWSSVLGPDDNIYGVPLNASLYLSPLSGFSILTRPGLRVVRKSKKVQNSEISNIDFSKQKSTN